MNEKKRSRRESLLLRRLAAPSGAEKKKSPEEVTTVATYSRRLKRQNCDSRCRHGKKVMRIRQRVRGLTVSSGMSQGTPCGNDAL